jgi:hypothetical protein
VKNEIPTGSAMDATEPTSAPKASAIAAACRAPKLPYFQTTSTPRSKTIAATRIARLRPASAAGSPISRPAAKFTATHASSTNTNSPAPQA